MSVASWFPSERGDEVVLRTGKLYVADWACSALEEAEVPHYRRQELSSGVEFAMPAAPSMGPGVWWVVRVPERAKARALEILEQLPVDLEISAGVWSFGPTTDARRFVMAVARACLTLILLNLVFGLVGLL